MDNLLAEYRGVSIVDTGLYKADRKHPLVLAGTHQLELCRIEGGRVGCVLFTPTPAGRAAALKEAKEQVDSYGQRGFSWVHPLTGNGQEADLKNCAHGVRCVPC